MIVTFWSSVSGQSGTSSNALAIAINKVIKHKKKVLLVNLGANSIIEHALIGNKSAEVLDNNGIDALIGFAKMLKIDENNLKNITLSFFKDQLNLLPGTKKKESEFNSYMENEIPKIMANIDKYYDYIFIDMPSGLKHKNSSLMKKSDLVVVNIPQNIMAINYLKNVNLNNNTMYLVGNYNCNSSYNLKNLAKIVPELKNSAVAIPYKTEFLDAINDSKVVAFMQKNNIYFTEENKDFMDGVEKACGFIAKYNLKEV